MSEAILEETIQEKEEKEAVVEGVSIYYIENGQGFPTVLLHG
jgi:myo-inositol-hexaphosphate 3-phosphohydrolase